MKKYLVLSMFALTFVGFAQQQTSPSKDRIAIAEQGPNSCSGNHKPGDHLSAYVLFDGDPTLESVSLRYYSQDRISENQRGFGNDFRLEQFRKLSPGKYLVEGTIPTKLWSG